MATANWHPIKYNEETRQFEGELPEVDEYGQKEVLITVIFGHYKSDYTDEYIPYGEDEYIVDGYVVAKSTYRTLKDSPKQGYFTQYTSSSIVAWDYVPKPYNPQNRKDEI